MAFLKKVVLVFMYGYLQIFQKFVRVFVYYK